MEAGVLPIIREFLSERGFELSEEKTVIPHIEDGFDFLGCNIRWYKDKLLTKLSKKNYKAIVSKVREIIKQNPSMKQEDLIRKLNPVIRGWGNFQKHNVSSQAFERFDVCGDGANVGTRRKDTNGSLRNISEELAQDTGHSV